MPDETKPVLKPCPRCDARGKVDSRDGKSWQKVSRLNPKHPDMMQVFAGTLTPVLCLDCEGSGFLPKPSDLKKVADEQAEKAEAPAPRNEEVETEAAKV